MIVQSPESAMPEPYKTYVRQRSEAIATVLESVTGEDNVQLCPRAITPEERIFAEASGHVYGAVVAEPNHGFKSVLYTPGFNSIGVVTGKYATALAYSRSEFAVGNRVRLKDPRESDGQGQQTIDELGQLEAVFAAMTDDNEFGCVLMPHIDQIESRVSVGLISLRGVGNFSYFGLEDNTLYNGSAVYGGTTLGLYHTSELNKRDQVLRHFAIDEPLAAKGERALHAYAALALECGRVSVDVIRGYTDNGLLIEDVVDVTPRVGGTTPAEVLALREIHADKSALCIASSRLLYDPARSPKTGVNFIDTDSLVINAQIHEVQQ